MQRKLAYLTDHRISARAPLDHLPALRPKEDYELLARDHNLDVLFLEDLAESTPDLYALLKKRHLVDWGLPSLIAQDATELDGAIAATELVGARSRSMLTSGEGTSQFI